MVLCNLRFKLDRLLNMAIKIEAVNHPGQFEHKIEGELLKLQERVSRLNVIYNLFSKAFVTAR